MEKPYYVIVEVGFKVNARNYTEAMQIANDHANQMHTIMPSALKVEAIPSAVEFDKNTIL
jgi:predicted small metal-binding protein